MSFLDELKKLTRPYSEEEDEYDYDEDTDLEPEPAPAPAPAPEKKAAKAPAKKGFQLSAAHKAQLVSLGVDLKKQEKYQKIPKPQNIEPKRKEMSPPIY